MHRLTVFIQKCYPCHQDLSIFCIFWLWGMCLLLIEIFFPSLIFLSSSWFLLCLWEIIGLMSFSTFEISNPKWASTISMTSTYASKFMVSWAFLFFIFCFFFSILFILGALFLIFIIFVSSSSYLSSIPTSFLLVFKPIFQPLLYLQFYLISIFHHHNSDKFHLFLNTWS